MKVIFVTTIDKYKGKFPTNYQIVPRVGEFVKISNYTEKHSLPFDNLEVKKVMYLDANNVLVELHLSELQSMQNKQYKKNVFD